MITSGIWSFLKEKMKLHGDKTALIYGARRLSYGELIGLVEFNNPPSRGKIVVCDNPDKLRNTVELLRAVCAGAVTVPICREYGEVYRERITTELADKKDVSIPPDVALIMFTSGSTGVPKGVMLTHKNIVSNLTAIDKYFKISGDILVARPIMHAAVLVGELLVSLYKGLTVHLYPEAFEPRRVLAYICKHKITTFCATPTLLNLLCRNVGEGADISLRVIAVSGEILSTKIAVSICTTFAKADIYSVYGLTEAAPRVSYLPPPFFHSKLTSIGIPLDGVKLELRGKGGKPIVGEGEGRLFVRSPGIMRGYFGQSELTKSKLKRGRLDTGDIARRDADGYYYIVGRADNMIIRGGMNVYPEEVEELFRRDDRIERVFCYAEPDPVAGKRVCVEIAGSLTREQAVEVAKTLPPYMRPSKIEVTEHSPRTANTLLAASGKTMRTTEVSFI